MLNFIVLTSFLGAVLSNPCEDYQTITGENRQQSHEPELTESLLCDRNRIIDGNWYRLRAGGGKLPETCVTSFHCGTRAPIYMNGQHPTGNNAVTRTICANYNDAAACCDWQEDIQVKRCESQGDVFYVYQLAPVPGCDLAYCVTDGNLCAPNTYLDPDTGECISYPRMARAPVLSDPIAPVNPLIGTFKFLCNVITGPQDQEARFQVHLLFFDPEAALQDLDDSEIITSDSVNLNMTNLSAEFDESYLAGHMGKTVACKARSYFEGSTDYSPYVRSENWYWIGVMGPSEGVELNEAIGVGGLTIELSSTVPITCSLCPENRQNNNCRYQFEVVTRMGDSNNVCTFRISSDPGDAAPLHIVKFPDTTIGGVRTQTISFEPLVMFPPPSHCIWQDYQPQDIPVTLVDTTSFGHCKSVTDPHTTMFDGTYYHNFRIGQFLLVKSRSQSGRNFEVHVRQDRCWNSNRVACNCAVAVREANTVIIVDYCEFVILTLRVVADNNPPIGDLIWIDDQKLEIKMPSGSKVTIEFGVFGRPYMNLHVYIPPEDYQLTEGLCGNYDGNRANDLTHGNVEDRGSHPNRFIESHRIPDGESFFDGHPQCENIALSTEDCRCLYDDGGRIECGAALGEYDNDVANFCGNRRKKDVSTIYGELEYEFDNTPDNNFDVPENEWPTANGFTEEYVTQVCTEILTTSSIYELCADYINDEEFLLGCIEDTRVADDLSMGYAALSDVGDSCVFNVENIPVNETISSGGSFNNTETDSEEDNRNAVEELLVQIRQNLCPNQCSQHGTCINSTCSCDQDYIGTDCGIQVNVAPVITSIHLGPLCDIQTRNCTNIKINANPITQLLNLTCAVRNVELLENGSHTLSSDVIYATPVFLNFAAMRCILPESPVSHLYNGEKKTEHGFLVSVSNDGQHFSDEHLFTVYDSSCRSCTSSGQCLMLSGTCSIDGICYDEEGICDDSVCQAYVDIGIPERSAAYQTTIEDLYLCDYNRIVEGSWYRFDQYTGGTMPDFCVDNWHCRTQYPIWFNGTHPTDQNPLIRGQVCSRAAGDHCCNWNHTIWARKCNVGGEQFFLYQLAIPESCPMAYCSGTIEPCDDSEGWDDATMMCQEIPVWSDWSQWSECSQTCDYGSTYRNRSCSVAPVEMCGDDAFQYETCFREECQAEGNPEGTLIEIPEEYLEDVLRNEEVFEDLVASVVYSDCIANPSDCCSILDFEGDISLNLDIDITEAFVCSISIDGHDENDNTITLFLSVTMNIEVIAPFCGIQYNYDYEGEGNMEIPSDVLTDVIEENSDTIEEETGIDIEIVTPSQQIEDEPSGEKKVKDTGNYTPLIAGLAVGVVVVGLIVGLGIFAAKKCNKPNRAISFASMGKPALSETNVRETEKPEIHPESFICDAPYSKPPESTTSTVNWREMRPKTGTKRFGTLPPLE